ncbi:efflux RND transporter periplasmic adaptor subunit [Iocasia frigidifontis]|uniref:Efflux RND transporter periplasmic adaptor subunit n=1 Tax=Iocasia fonsfrigidae TaxID=2682810 RepID=A0A8A7KBT1_9FIRM|nr:efflux RND transporter periplasmic adaptor subunit [Iocasia fonsfrigidae]QTL96809.1 efflux RND transporter periplasmic adaptor subunit [Iocasia fonsfrigidae]
MKNKIGIFTILIVLLINTVSLAQSIPVRVVEAELKDLAEIKVVNGKIEPYKSIQISPEIGGIIDEVNVEVGDFVKKGQSLIVFDQDNLKAQLKQAEAAVELAQANLDMLENGATPEEIAQVEASYQSAMASFEGAKTGLEIIESIYHDKSDYKQQLTSSNTQLESGRKQLSIADEQLNQARVAYNQASTDYERMKTLYNEGAITRKEFEGVETQYKNAQSALKTAELGKEQAQINYNGALESYQIVEDVYQNPHSLKQQLDNARTQLEVARANLQTAEANLAKVKKGAREEERRSARASLKQSQASLELARIQFENSVVKSPNQGIISAVNVEVGEMLGAGTPVINLVDLDQVYVKVNVNADTLTRIKVGDQVSVDLLAFKDGISQGEITNISPVIDQQAQAYPVKILLDNEDNKIYGGMFADVSFILNRAENTVVIPINAVLDLDGNPYVFAVDGDKVVKKEIEIGIINANELEVIDGISPEDILVIQGQNSLQNGDLVEVVD